MKIVVATKNPGKVREIKEILAHKRIQVCSLLDFPNFPEIKETGKSFYENALTKARQVNQKTSLPALADDSGLEVDALNNRPGILSARYAGTKATDQERINKLLSEMKGIPDSKRKGRFVCCMVFCDHNRIFHVTGFCDGTISRKPSGRNGFGYDPVFFLPELGKTMAQLDLDEKNKISHRSNALKKIKEMIFREYKII